MFWKRRRDEPEVEPLDDDVLRQLRYIYSLNGRGAADPSVIAIAMAQGDWAAAERLGPDIVRSYKRLRKRGLVRDEGYGAVAITQRGVDTLQRSPGIRGLNLSASEKNPEHRDAPAPAGSAPFFHASSRCSV